MGQMAMGGSGGHGDPGSMTLVPSWLGVVWTLAFLAIAVAHGGHAARATGQRRAWHAGHVAIAAAMVVMFIPTWLGAADAIGAWWQPTFLAAAAVVAAWVLATALAGRPVNRLWLLVAVDLVAMAAMGSTTHGAADLHWILVGWCAAAAALWLTGGYRRLDAPLSFGPVARRVAVDGDAAVVVTPCVAAGTLAGRVELRLSMAVMAIGMAYMLAAMQLTAAR